MINSIKKYITDLLSINEHKSSIIGLAFIAFVVASIYKEVTTSAGMSSNIRIVIIFLGAFIAGVNITPAACDAVATVTAKRKQNDKGDIK